jgi:integrase/recombinase XerC
LKAYAGDLDDFAAWAGAPSADEAARLLLAAGQGPANEAALNYRGSLLQRGLSPATVNRRLAALRSLVKLARTLAMVGWALEVPSVRGEAYRDTAGPGAGGFRRLLDQLAGRTDAKATRDRALLQLLYHLGLRRAEVVALDREDLDLQAATVAVLGKGRREKVKLSLPPATAAALAAWLAVRGAGLGALFTPLDRASRDKGRRLTGNGVYAIVRGLGERAGLRARPHGLRHSAITRALDLGADVRAVQRFSRHKDIRVLLKYDDNRTDLGGGIARRLADEAA